MDLEMRTDTELLNDLTATAPLVQDRVTRTMVTVSRKVIAHWTGLSLQTISDYCHGKYNIPISFWRKVLEHYLDPRIVRLLVPDNCDYELHPREFPARATSRDFFREMLKVEGAHHQMMARIADILADGRVDELDESGIQEYDDEYQAHRFRDDLLHRGILAAFAQNQQLAESRR